MFGGLVSVPSIVCFFVVVAGRPGGTINAGITTIAGAGALLFEASVVATAEVGGLSRKSFPAPPPDAIDNGDATVIL